MEIKHINSSSPSIQAVILAAGTSSRMGCSKQLLEVNGEKMLDRAISVVLEAGFARPLLILGAYAAEIELHSQLAARCEIIVNANFNEGQSSSLKLGVQHLLPDYDAALFMLCDQPFISAGVLRELVQGFLTRQPDALYPVYQGKRGNPVIISSSLFPRLRNLTGDTGARCLFKDKSLDTVAHDIEDPCILIDLDTPEEYRKYM